MESLRITYSEMSDQLKKICNYYFFDKNFSKNKMLPIFDEMEKCNDKTAEAYADQYESDTDSFIYEIVNHIDGDREKSIKLVNEAKDEILYTFIVRLTAFESYCIEHPTKIHLLLGVSNKQLAVDCLINFWRSYRQASQIII